MNIKVWDDKYIIKSDSLCYKVSEIKQKAENNEDENIDVEKTDNGEYEVIIGYVNNVAQAFRLIVDREGRNNKCSTLNGYIKHITAINKKLEDNIMLFANMVGGKGLVERAMLKMASEEQ